MAKPRAWVRGRPVFPPCVLLACVLAVTALPAGAVGTVELALPDLNGKLRTLAEFRGRWVIVNYWATWCPPCLREIPELQRFYARHRDRDAVVLGVNFEDIKPSWLRALARRRQYPGQVTVSSRIQRCGIYLYAAARPLVPTFCRLPAPRPAAASISVRSAAPVFL